MRFRSGPIGTSLVDWMERRRAGDSGLLGADWMVISRGPFMNRFRVVVNDEVVAIREDRVGADVGGEGVGPDAPAFPE